MRRLTGFDCAGAWCAASLDEGDTATGLLIVSGGNEIRSGAHAGQAALAAHFAALGHPVFRYDRRGVGESEGENGGFESAAADLAAAVAAFRAEVPHLDHIVAFGNCDAASALALFHAGLAIDRLVLANPWVIEAADADDLPAPATIRSRYWARLKNPRSLIDLFTGRIDLRKLFAGLVRATRHQPASALSGRVAAALHAANLPVSILLAARDTTAMAFAAAWKGSAFDGARNRPDVAMTVLDSASHSFAGTDDRQWLLDEIGKALTAAR